MSMSHINPNSPQTRAWVEYAHKTEGRIQKGFSCSGDKKRKTNKAAAYHSILSEEKHKKVCELLDMYSHEECRTIQLHPKANYSCCSSYTRLLCDIGYLELSDVRGKTKWYRRVRHMYPTASECKA